MKTLNKGKARDKDLSLIAINIAKLYEEDINFLKIIDLLDELPLRKDYKESVKMISQIIKRGGSLEEGFSIDNKLFPGFFVSMISMGESTGKISKVFNSLGIFYEKMELIKKKLINTLTYPAILIVALIVLFMFVIFFFIPNMTNVYEEMGNGMPKIYNSISKFTEFTIEYPFITSIFVVFWGVLLPYILFKNYFKKYIRILCGKIPIYKLFNEYLVISIMSVIVNSGINISAGINQCCNCNLLNSIAKEKLIIMNESIMRGKSIRDSMDKSKLFSKYTLAHIKLGEESGTIDERLSVLQEELFLRLGINMDNLLKLIEPISIITMAAIVIVFLFVFILPLFNNIFSI